MCLNQDNKILPTKEQFISYATFLFFEKKGFLENLTTIERQNPRCSSQVTVSHQVRDQSERCTDWVPIPKYQNPYILAKAYYLPKYQATDALKN